MAKTVTLRLPDELYEKFKEHSKIENRTLSNFIETAAKIYVEEIEFSDHFEMKEIFTNKPLLESLRRGSKDARLKRGRFVK